MRSLFFTIFLRFWLTVVLVGVALSVTVGLYLSSRSPDEWGVLVQTLLPAETKHAAEAFETSGAPALGRYLDHLQRQYGVRVFLFTDEGKDVLGAAAPADVQRVAALALVADGLRVQGPFAGQRATGPSGRTYTLVLWSQRGKSVRGLQRFVIALPVIVVLAAALFCYLITRHITAPVFQLRAAAAMIAGGHFETRVGPALERRRDELGDLGRDFDRMAAQIESSVTAQQRLLGDVSHELRSPLSRLVVALGLLKQCPREEAFEYIARIGLEVRRLDALIEQLLMLSRIDSAAHVGSRTSVDLTNLVQEVASDADFEARARGRSVLVMEVGPCTLVGFEELLRSAVENVVRNAVRHTREGTTVDVSLRLDRRYDGERAVIRVRDHGAGVPETMLSAIFLPLRRVAASAEGNLGGAGLGLAITARAISVHGGTVHAMNGDGDGLIVEIELPLISASV